ncbi:MAG TPA: NAD(P)-dependent oxidoreductase [Solirubrobacteraceae bacterium]|nr:NAD(P)-dependent oxidoreductase [Solirubrobacteraceae bacterium]
MADGRLTEKRLGWVGCGRMGRALATRLLEAGCDLAVYNRTRAKAEPLAELGATIVDAPPELADRDIVFTTLAGSADFEQVVAGPGGLLSSPDGAPSVIVDSTTISAEASENVRTRAAERGTALLAAPVSGNPKVVQAGRLTMVISGPEDAYEQARPFLETLAGGGLTYAGDGDRARLVKVCHNLMLGIVAQTLAEILVVGEKGGVSRASMMEFLNNSVLGSTFTRYKTPAYVNLDFSPTFTPPLLLKDFELGHEAARELGVPMPVAAAAQQVVQALVGDGYTDVDFAALIALQAKLSGLELEPEGAQVSDGLERAA